MPDRRARILAVAALASCRELPPLPAGVCGNGVVETGEDCDRVVDPALGPRTACGDEADARVACRYVCDDAVVCPMGWACRDDGVCHHRTGQWEQEPASAVAWFGDAWWAGEVDGDGVADVVGVVGAELRVVRGDGAGRLGEELRRPLPIGTDETPVVGDLDGDGRLDAVVPSPQGLVVLRGDPRTTLEPVAFAPFAVPAGDQPGWVVPLRLEGLAPEHTPVLLTDTPAGVLMEPWVGGRVELASPRTLEGRSLRDVPDPRPVIGDLDESGVDELVLSFDGDPEVAVCTSFQVIWDPPERPLAFGCTWISLGVDPDGEARDEPHRVLRGAHLADADGDGATDLLVSVRGSPASPFADRVVLLPGDGRGGFGEPSLDARFTTAAGELPAPGWPLDAGQLDGLGPDDFVTPTGVWISDPETGELVRSDEPLAIGAPGAGRASPWREAIVLDFDGRGLPDVVVADRYEPVLHVLVGGHEPGPHAPLDVSTVDGLASFVRAGDFNGDLIQDVAFRDGPVAVSVLFGGTEQPVHVASIEGLVHLETGALLFPPDLPRDPIADIVVSTAPTGGVQRGAVFVGAASRSLEAPLLLASGTSTSRPRAAIVGRFIPGERSAEAADLVALAGLRSSPSFWLVTNGATSFAEPRRIEHEAREGLGCARWSAGDVDADGDDELVGVPGETCEGRSGSAALRVDFDDAGHATITELPVPLAAGVRDTAVADVDGDGAADLLRVTEGGVDVAWSDGVTLLAPSILPSPPDAEVPRFALPLQADADPALELVVATATTIWLAEIAGGRRLAWGSVPIAHFGASRLAVGDLDRDGLPDLIAGDGTRLVVLRARSHLETPP